MVIVRLENGREVIALLPLEDGIEKHFACSKDEIIQWLVSNIVNPNLAIWTASVNGEISAYLVARYVDMPPLANYIYILYYWSEIGYENSLKVLEQLTSWAKGLGVDSIRINAEDPSEFHKYGFKEVNTSMELRL